MAGVRRNTADNNKPEPKKRSPKNAEAEAPKKRGGGRPKKVIDYDTVEKLAMIQCTQDEISSFLGISTRTLQKDKEFLRLYKKGMDNGKISLRRKQFKIADKNPSMAIFLGKQYLGQTDKVDNSMTFEDESDPLSKAFEELMSNDKGIQRETTEDSGISEN